MAEIKLSYRFPVTAKKIARNIDLPLEEILLQRDSKLEDSELQAVNRIVWKYTLAGNKIAVVEDEIQIIELYLDDKKNARTIIKEIDLTIPYLTVFIVRYKKDITMYFADKYIADGGSVNINGGYFSKQVEADCEMNLSEGQTIAETYKIFVSSFFPDIPNACLVPLSELIKRENAARKIEGSPRTKKGAMTGAERKRKFDAKKIRSGN